ncbi:MAG: DNA-3-methyladenine glycosylase [Candidatus Nezhaarchaeales archaeon]
MSINAGNELLSKSFYLRDPAVVAIELLGARLVRIYQDYRLSGVIVETEAYYGSWDPASRAHKSMKGDLARTLYGEVGHALIYGFHRQWLLNVVAHPNDDGGAVLIRAIEPFEGIDIMMKLRGIKDVRSLTNGPGKLTRALSIDKSFHKKPLYTMDHGLWIEKGENIDPSSIAKSKRIGVSKDLPQYLRFYVKDNPYVSKP